MILSIGSDHRGFFLKEKLKTYLESLGHRLVDKGSFDESAVDYPLIARSVGASVSSGESERGILFCGTGLGMSMAANRIKGIRAALCHNTVTAQFSIQHNNANIFCFGTDILEAEEVKELLSFWLSLSFNLDDPENERHQRRIKLIEERCF